MEPTKKEKDRTMRRDGTGIHAFSACMFAANEARHGRTSRADGGFRGGIAAGLITSPFALVVNVSTHSIVQSVFLGLRWGWFY